VIRKSRLDSRSCGFGTSSLHPRYLNSESGFSGTILVGHASAAFICAIRDVCGSNPRPLGQLSAVRSVKWSGVGDPGYTGCLKSGNTGPPFVTKRVRCSRGCLPASGGPPTGLRKLLPPISLTPVTSCPAKPWRSRVTCPSPRSVARTTLQLRRSRAGGFRANQRLGFAHGCDSWSSPLRREPG
jgi:hypothetical protein